VAEAAVSVRALRREIMPANGWSPRELCRTLQTPGVNRLRDAHAALDTNGCLGDRLSVEELGLIDLMLLDLKAMSANLHRRLTAMENQPVLAFARRLAALGRPVWVRFVLVPGFTDDLAEVDRIAAFAAELGNVERVDVLPFHQLGKFKREKLSLHYELRDTQSPSPEKTQEAIARFCQHGLEAF
jgi:pyruvate formate lyase activating enzyme